MRRRGEIQAHTNTQRCTGTYTLKTYTHVEQLGQSEEEEETYKHGRRRRKHQAHTDTQA
jgi:hypothetical protein